MKPTIAFFGTPQESVTVVSALKEAGYPIVVAITKPAKPVGRKQILTDTAVAIWAKENSIPLLTPAADEKIYWKYQDEEKLISAVLSYKPDLIVVADYTQKIPMKLITATKHGGLNVHPSLLPSYRGPAPVPWALFNGETKTGVSIVTLEEEFDSGVIIAQKEEIVKQTDTTLTLLPHLFKKGAALLIEILPEYIKTHSPITAKQAYLHRGIAIKASKHPRMSRDDGFEPWENIKKAMETGKDAERIYNKWRGFHPWPGLWTLRQVQGKQTRMKILACELLDQKLIVKTIQFEGKNPAAYSA